MPSEQLSNPPKRIQTAQLAQARDQQRRAASKAYLGFVTVIAGLICLLAVLVIGTIIVRGAPAINWTFLTAPPVDGMTAGGIGPMIMGTLLLMLGAFLITLPIGILGGIYLAEYAGRGKAIFLIRGLVTSLAGTPSIIYGLFGAAAFVALMNLGTSLRAGWLTLGLMALPYIVLSTETAMRAVPNALVDGALSLGLTRWQTIFRISLPYALPGIMTGVISAVGRVAGEAPPILLTAGIYYATDPPRLDPSILAKPVMNLPYHLAEGYRQGTTIPESIIWGTCLCLLATILIINATAIAIRSWARKRGRA